LGYKPTPNLESREDVMAGSPEKTEYEHMAHHTDTWATFVRLAKWTIILTVIFVLGMAAFLTGSHNALR
jgi:hypothetical protein